MAIIAPNNLFNLNPDDQTTNALIDPTQLQAAPVSVMPAQPGISTPGAFAGFLADPANVNAIAPYVADRHSIKPQPAPDFYNSNSNLLAPGSMAPDQAKALASAQPKAPWFNPGPALSTQQPQVNAQIAPVPAQANQPATVQPSAWFNPGGPAKIQPQQPAQAAPQPVDTSSVAPWFTGGQPTQSLPQAQQPAVQSQTQADQQKLRDLATSGAGLNKIQNPFLRDLAKVGDIAGSILLPHVMPLIPGTTLRNKSLQAQQAGIVGQDQAADENVQNAFARNLQNQEAQANIASTNAKTAQLPILTRAKIAQAQAQSAEHGLKPTFDDNGNQTGWEPDESSPVYQKNKAAIDVMESQNELRQAQTELTKSKNDPNSPAFKQAQQRLAVAQQNANAAQTRASAYMGNYLQGAYNTGLNGQTLPGAPQIANDQGGVSTVGSKNASAASKAQSNTAQFNDVYGALDSADAAADALVKSGGKLNSPAVIQAFKQPKGTIGQYLQSEVVKGNLTPAERDYVTALQAAHENVQAMRKSAGGTATDSSVAKLDALIPNESTPDIDYFKRQTKQIRNTANRLSSGVTTAKGGLSVNNGKGASGSTPDGTLPPQAASQLKEGHNTAFGNGQVWTLKNGQPQRIK